MKTQIRRLCGWMDETRDTFGAVLLYTFVIGMLAHAYSFFHSSFILDSLIIDQLPDTPWQLSIGRPMIPVYYAMRASLNLPWLIGCLALFFLALAVYLMIRLLGIRSRISVMSVCGLCATCVTLAAGFATYNNTMDAYMFALLLNVFGIYITEKKRFGFVLGGLCCGVAMGLYQSYVQVAFALIVILRIRDVLNKEGFVTLVVRTVRGLGVIAAAGLLYAVSTAVTREVTGVELIQNYNSIKGMLNFNGFDYKDLILYMYRNVGDFHLYPNGYQTELTVAVNRVLLYLGVLELALCVIRRRLNPLYIGYMVIGLYALPPAINFVYVLTKGMIHQLMYFSYLMVYVLGLTLHEYLAALPPERVDPEGKWHWRLLNAKRAVLLVCVFLLLRNGVIFSNTAYLKRDLDDKANLSIMTRVADRIESTPEYVLGETPVVVIGEFQNAQMANVDRFSRFDTTFGMDYRVPVSGNVPQYFNYVLQRRIALVTDGEQQRQWQSREDVAAMPVFPYEGYVRVIDGTVVVKLSQP